MEPAWQVPSPALAQQPFAGNVRTMLASPYALACVLLLGVVLGYFFAVRTVGIACVALLGADIAAMAILGVVGAKGEVAFYLGVLGMAWPFYAAITCAGALAGRAIRGRFAGKS